MHKYNDITIVIVSYKSKKQIIKLLKKIKINFKVIIIENSSDFSIKDYFKKSYTNIDIFFPGNIGYGCSANYARTKISTKYFFLLNPDIIGIDNQVIEYFIKYANKLNDNFSCLGPRYKNIDNKNFKQSNIKHKVGFVKAISGAAMFFNTKNFDLIGGFDKNIFLYFEETDFCKRGQKINLFSYQLNNIKIDHFVGNSVEYESDDEKKNIQNLRNWHFIWSKYYYFQKHYGFFVSILFFSPTILRAIFKIFYSYLKKNNQNIIKYKTRLNGLIHSIRGKKSLKRIN